MDADQNDTHPIPDVEEATFHVWEFDVGDEAPDAAVQVVEARLPDE